MKDKAFVAGMVVVVIVLIGSALYGMRLFNNAATPITVHEVEPGVKCATMVTTDGVAIDCWKI